MIRKIVNIGFCLSFLTSCEAKETDKNLNPTTEHARNSQSETLLYKVREAQGGEKPVLVILLHGYGANEDDLQPIAQYFPENYIVVTPQAPYKIGQQNYQWYTGEKDKDGGFGAKTDELSSSIQKVETLVKDLQNQYKVSASRTFIGGFSQGANMSYHLGLKDPSLCKGIGVLSGTIFSSLQKEHEKDKASSLKIFIGHGNLDDRIPYTEAVHSKNWLDQHHFESELHTYTGMSHSISPEEVQDFISFTIKNL
ncbi:dienelactone hydrolase family protein [Chryseobacterium sp. MYb264]|uniref:alpha/beta hydrolase n=1 Tax=Chryseobacterium sp. MYb264 TaxID=2745153 RepID=UPI002E0D7111|nr:dienelactone hydrolase family protein [Chryseobacterium sp. MYb264]